MEQEFVADDVLTVSLGPSDEEIRLTLVTSMLTNRQNFSIDRESVADTLNYWVKYVKTGEK